MQPDARAEEVPLPPEDPDPTAHRVWRLALICSIAWFGFGLVYLPMGRTVTATLDATLSALCLVVGLAVRHTPTAAPAGSHLLTGFTLCGLTGAALLSGQTQAMALWFVPATIVIPAYTLPNRSVVPWTLAAAVALVLVWLSPFLVSLQPEFVASGPELLFGQIAMLAALYAAAGATRAVYQVQVDDTTRRQVAAEAQQAVYATQAAAHERARDAAKREAERRTTFAATLSHEIRTPMNGVMGLAQLLLDKQTQEENRELARKLVASGHDILALVNEVLDFAQLETGGVELERMPLNLHDLIDKSLAPFAFEAWRKGIDMGAVIQPDLPDRIVGDPVRLQQVLSNLVGNATKFVRDGGTVRVDVAEEPGTLVIRVSDDGDGMSPAMVKRVFRPFDQGGPSVRRRFGGTGLGLALCRNLTRLMGGDVEVESLAGHGTTFTVTLPLSPAAEASIPMWTGRRVLLLQPRPAAADAIQSRLEHHALRVDRPLVDDIASAWKSADWEVAIVDISLWPHPALERDPRRRPVIIMDPNPRSTGGPAEGVVRGWLRAPVGTRDLVIAIRRSMLDEDTFAADEEPTGPFDAALAQVNPLAILVVDDHPTNLLVAKLMLEGFGYAPATVGDPATALDAVDQIAYDVVLMDMYMPGMDGLETARRVLARRPDTIVVMTTANPTEELRERARREGIVHFLDKPILTGQLAALLSELFETTDSTQPIVDPPPQDDDPLARLRGLCVDDQSLRELVHTWVTSSIENMDAIDAAVEAADDERIRRVAHKMKGSSGLFNATQVVELASDLEARAAEAGERADLARQLRGCLLLATQRVQRALEAG